MEVEIDPILLVTTSRNISRRVMYWSSCLGSIRFCSLNDRPDKLCPFTHMKFQSILKPRLAVSAYLQLGQLFKPILSISCKF